MPDDRPGRIKIRVEEKDYEVTGGTFQQILAAVKALPKRRFNGQLKLWEVSGSLDMVRGQLENSGFTVAGGTPVAKAALTEPSTYTDQIKVNLAGQAMAVTGDSFGAMLEIIKAIPGRRFDVEAKQWVIPGTFSETKAQLAKHNLTLEILPGQPALPADQAVEGTNADYDQADPFAETAVYGPSETVVPPPPPPPPADFFQPDDFYDEEIQEYEDLIYEDIADPFAPPPPAEMPASAGPPAGSASGRRDQIRVIVANQALVVVGGTFQEMLAAIKTIPDRRFDGESKQWLLPNDVESVQQHLAAKGFRLEE